MADSTSPNQNRLAEESSPYLLQHAQNPVDWYPWSDEAFEKARREDKPILVSIGYATCHWCHVMAHESFEDEQVANIMNEYFVNIKVDREERPDIDNTYMLVCQMLTGSGGWPLNVFLTPEKKPFYAATYIPKTGRQGRPGMLQLLPRLAQLWENDREKISSSTDEIISAFQKSNQFEGDDELDELVLDKAYSQFEQQFDDIHGGFGTSPKFPSAHNLMLLLRYGQRNPDSEALEMVEQTLTQMRQGGIFDHIGWGFHRYSTDQKWLVPHFEKMLYDQAILLIAYTETWQLTGNELFKKTTSEIFTYLIRKMQDEDGGFYSAEDADSEGEEGKFYVWSVSEIRDLLPTAEAELAIEIFNFTEEGNYADEATGQRTGKNIPHLTKPLEELAEEREMDEQQLADSIKSIRTKLLDARQERVHPLLDDKILTDWNGLIIAALAKAGRAFQNEHYIKQAENCWNFITSTLIDENVSLKHRYRNGDVAIDAHADDYAFLVWAAIELYQTTFKSDYLGKAVALNRQFIEHFWDKEDSGFYFTSESAEELLGRKKEIYDGAMPSSNSVAIMNLLRLGRITGNSDWEQMANEAQKRFAQDIKKAPTGFGAALQSIYFTTGESKEIIIAGKRDNPDTQKMLQLLHDRFLPNGVILLNDPNDEKIRQLAPYLSDYDMQDGRATAYVCQDYSCELPTTSSEEMVKLIDA